MSERAIRHQTVARYLDLLVDLLLVRRLPPWHRNEGKRLVRSPKLYVRDSGVVHALLRLSSLEDVLGHTVAGGSWEGLAIESISAAAPEGTDASFSIRPRPARRSISSWSCLETSAGR